MYQLKIIVTFVNAVLAIGMLAMERKEKNTNTNIRFISYGSAALLVVNSICIWLG